MIRCLQIKLIPGIRKYEIYVNSTRKTVSIHIGLHWTMSILLKNIRTNFKSIGFQLSKHFTTLVYFLCVYFCMIASCNASSPFLHSLMWLFWWFYYYFLSFSLNIRLVFFFLFRPKHFSWKKRFIRRHFFNQRGCYNPALSYTHTALSGLYIHFFVLFFTIVYTSIIMVLFILLPLLFWFLLLLLLLLYACSCVTFFHKCCSPRYEISRTQSKYKS